MSFKFKNNISLIIIKYFCFVKYLFSIFFFISFFSYGQELAEPTFDQVNRNSYSLGIHFNTLGWGVFGEFTKQKTYKYHHVLSAQISNIHHKNEFKISNISQTRSYFYKKINSLVGLRFSLGGNLKLFESQRENGIEVQFKWKAGPLFGLLKPVYLDISKGSGTLSNSERYDPEKHGISVVDGRSNWFKGVGASKMNFGLHQKIGFNFNFSKNKNSISGGEIGFMVDYFPLSDLKIMYGTDNYKLFTCFYLQFELGNKF